MRELNAIQTLSVFGIIFSVIVQIILFVIHKHVAYTWALYPTWIGIFLLGTIIKKYAKNDHHHH